MKKYYLGLTISKDTIGWAISSSDNKIEDFGVQVWDAPNKHFGVLKKSRFKTKKKQLLKTFLNDKIIQSSSEKIPQKMSIDEWIKEAKLQKNLRELKNSTLLHNHKLNNKELVWILLTYINKRGEGKLGSFKKKNKNKAISIKNIVKETSHYSKAYLDSLTSITDINNALSKSNNNKNNKDNHVFTRLENIEECEKILINQNIDEATIKQLIDLIFNDDLKTFNYLSVEETKKEKIVSLKEQIKTIENRNQALKMRNIKSKDTHKKIRTLTKEKLRLNKDLFYINKKNHCYYYPNECVASTSSIIKSLYDFCEELSNSSLTFKNPISLIVDFFKFKNKEIIQRTKGLWRILNEKILIKDIQKKKRLDCFVDWRLNFNTIKNLNENNENINEVVEFLKNILEFDKKISPYLNILNEEKQYEKVKNYLNESFNDIQWFKNHFFKPIFPDEDVISFKQVSLKFMYDAIISFITKGIDISTFISSFNDSKLKFPKTMLKNDLKETFAITSFLNKRSKNKVAFRVLTNIRKLIINIHKFYRSKFKISDDMSLFESINITFSPSPCSIWENQKNKTDGLSVLCHELDIPTNNKYEKINENDVLEDKISAIIFYNNLNRNKNTRMLVKLFLEQGGEVDINNKYSETKSAKCLLTFDDKNENITLKDIKNKKVDNGHIISALYGIDRIENRFIVRKTANIKQKSFLPYEYILKLKKNSKDKYAERVKKLYKNNNVKKELLLWSSLDNKRDFLVKQLIFFNDQYNIFIIKEAFYKWFLIELLKRDYIFNKKRIEERVLRENNYEYWFKESLEQIKKRICVIDKSWLPTIRKNLLSPNELEKSNENVRTWIEENGEEIKRVTKWDHALDAISLSWIQNRIDSFTKHFDQKKESIKILSKEIITPNIKKIDKEFDSLKQKLEFILKQLKNKKNLKDKKSVLKESDTIKTTNKLKKNINKKKKTIEVPSFNNLNISINNIIPIKVNKFICNKISYLIFDLIWNKNIRLDLKNTKSIDMFASLISTNVSKISIKQQLESKKYINRNSLPLCEFLLFEINSLYAKNLKFSKKALKQLLKRFIFFIDFLTNIKKEIVKNESIFSLFVLYRWINDFSKFKKQKNKIISTILPIKINKIILPTKTLIYVENLDHQPKKVIKRVSDGKLRYQKEVIIEKWKPLSIKSLEKVFKIYKKGVQDIIKDLFLYRKKPSEDLKNEINDQLKKVFIIMDKFGHLRRINSFIGFLYDKDKEEPINLVTFYEFNEKCTKGEFMTNDIVELLFFNKKTIYNIKKNNKKTIFSNYPITPVLDVSKNTKQSLIIKGFSMDDLVLDKNYLTPVSSTLNLRKEFLVFNKKVKIKINNAKKITFNGDII